MISYIKGSFKWCLTVVYIKTKSENGLNNNEGKRKRKCEIFTKVKFRYRRVSL